MDVSQDPVCILSDLESPVKFVLSNGFSEDVAAVAAQVAGESERLSVHSFLQSGNECADRGWLLLLLCG